MRRLVLVCLLLVLPLQWPWAALASDCCPECACASEHPAPSGGARAAADGANDATPVGCDADCLHCQGPGPAALVGLPTLTAPMAGDLMRAVDAGPLPDPVPEHPLRPPQA